MVDPNRQSILRFGVFELDLAAGEFRKRGLRMRVQRQPFQILLALLERPGELISRSDLRKRLWPDNVFLDFEHELNKALNKLRLALCDDARSPRFIETHFGQGYRFIAPVQTSYDHEVSDPFAFQHEIARGIAESLKLELRPERLAAYERSRGHNAHAREAYLKGRYHWSGRTEASLRKSLAYFREAIAADPKHALAHVGLAESYVVMGNLGMLAPEDAITFARDAVLRALDVNPQLAEAHASLGWIRFAHDRDWAASQHEFELVSKLNPNYVTAPHWHAYVQAALGEFDSALAINGRALLIDPLSLPANAARGWLLFLALRYDQAIEQCKATVELDPMHWLGHLYLAMAYTAKQQHANAIVEYEIARECSSDLPMMIACSGHGYAAAGDFTAAQRVLDELAVIRKTRYVPSYRVALVYAGLGLADEAFEWLLRAYDERCEWLAFMNVDPRLDHLHADARFQSLASKLHLPSPVAVQTEPVAPANAEVCVVPA